MDLTVKSYATFELLERYCYCVAGTVGLCCVHVFGFQDPGALELALAPEPAVRAASADAVVVLDEFYPWLTSLEGLRRPASEIPMFASITRLPRAQSNICSQRSIASTAGAGP